MEHDFAQTGTLAVVQVCERALGAQRSDQGRCPA
jgi:hypothetical protein